MPIEIKKMPLKQSRSGSTSAITWWLSSDSEMTRPATNAPRASDKPAIEESQAVPRQTKTTKRINTSRLRTNAT